MAWQIGVDVGGTFTDLLALDPERGVFRVAKVPSTPEDQSVGFLAGLAVLDTDLAAVAALIHGTTVATNAVLERKGARCGLITTAGFRDVLELQLGERVAERNAVIIVGDANDRTRGRIDRRRRCDGHVPEERGGRSQVDHDQRNGQRARRLRAPLARVRMRPERNVIRSARDDADALRRRR